MDLQGKVALVGGSSQGIGRGMAEALARAGATCLLLARNSARLQEAVEGLDRSAGQDHRFIVADFAHPDELRREVENSLSGLRPTILINNTGGPPAGPITEASPEAFRQAFEQHLIVNHLLVQLLISTMKEERYGRIINVISTSVKVPLQGLGVSNTTRGAVASWAKTLANELGEFGITVNNILPGATRTQRLESIIGNKASKTGRSPQQVEADMLAEIPARRFGTIEDLGALACFLASPLAGYINGTSIPVDGGRTGSI